MTYLTYTDEQFPRIGLPFATAHHRHLVAILVIVVVVDVS